MRHFRIFDKDFYAKCVDDACKEYLNSKDLDKIMHCYLKVFEISNLEYPSYDRYYSWNKDINEWEWDLEF